MCHIIKPRNILINYFAHSKGCEVSITTLLALKRKIERNLKYKIIVDASSDSIFNTVCLNSDKFIYKETKILITPDYKKQLQALLNSINHSIPEDLREIYTQCFISKRNR